MKADFFKTKMTRKMAAKYFLLKKAIPRSLIAQRFLRGHGLEIGALHNPVVVWPWASSKYLDRMSAEALVKEYPELAGFNLVKPDIIDNGEDLSTVLRDSQDFIIANHFIEHCENPIQTIFNFSEKLKLNGRLFLAVPDKNFTFDICRPSTSFEHLVADYECGPQLSREAHYLEWCTLIAPPQSKAKELMSRSYSIHFHVWTKLEFSVFLKEAISKYQLPLRLLATYSVVDEAIFILEKYAVGNNTHS